MNGFETERKILIQKKNQHHQRQRRWIGASLDAIHTVHGDGCMFLTVIWYCGQLDPIEWENDCHVLVVLVHTYKKTNIVLCDQYQ